MRQDEHHQQELERQQMIDELAEEANFHIHTAVTIPVESVSKVENGIFYVSAYNGRAFKITVEEV